MQEVDGLTVDLGRVLRELIQSGLVLAPVIAGAPVLSQLLEIAQRDPPAPADVNQLVGPACVGQAVVQIVQVGLGNDYFERLDTQVHIAPLLLCICDRRPLLCRPLPEDLAPLAGFLFSSPPAINPRKATRNLPHRHVRFDQRNGRKNARTSSTNSLGSSSAAKCPPRGIFVQCLTRKKRSPSSRGGTVRSLGNVATTAGTSIYCPALS